MLAPDDRLLLLGALRPPPGTRLKHAVGTTFTLDLNTALTVPLAFAGHSLSESPDPIAIMEALRSSSAVLDIFCQSGAVSTTRWPSDLVALLEPVIHEVPRPRPGHLFHPKIWVAHYGAGEDVDQFRVLVLSRNLTADRSWDLVARLDGELGRRNRGNDGLVRFLTSLTKISKYPLPEERAVSIRLLADQMSRVEWELPEGARSARFLPLGLPKEKGPKFGNLFTGYRHLVISPFVTEGGLDTVIRPEPSGSEVTIVSRAEELDRLPTNTLKDCSTFVINALAGLEFASDTVDESAEPTATSLSALHAKAVVVESEASTRLYLGSANATDAAFSGNIEMLVEFEGRRRILGVKALIGPDAPFLTLLEEYTPPEEPIADEAAEVGRRLDAFLIDAAQLAFTVSAEPTDDGWTARITTEKPLPPPPHDAAVRISPLNRPLEQTSLEHAEPVDALLGSRDGADLTPFLLLSARAKHEGQEIERCTVVKALLVGGPEDRLSEILVRQIDSPEKFLRLLFLLLGFRDPLGGDTPSASTPWGDGSWQTAGSSGIFELLVSALARDPRAIDRLDEIVSRLRDREDEVAVLPTGWDDVWSAILEARKLVGARP